MLQWLMMSESLESSKNDGALEGRVSFHMPPEGYAALQRDARLYEWLLGHHAAAEEPALRDMTSIEVVQSKFRYPSG